MKAIFFNKNLGYTDTWPVPEPREGEALIRILLAGICNTDIEITRGYLGFSGILGHEFVGIVESCPGEEKDLIGKRVVGDINCACGVCDYCRKGLRTHCPDRTTLGIAGKDGAHSGFVTLSLENIHVVPENVSDEEAVFVEPLAAALEILEQVHVRPTDKVLIMGDGKMGILCALALKSASASLILAGRHDDKLLVAQRQGVATINVSSSSPATRGYDMVVEATGTAEGLEEALLFVKPRGKVVLKSTVAQGKEINLTPLVIDEITVVGSRCGPFEPALRALTDRLLDVKSLITAVYRPEDAQRAFKKALENGSLKVLIDFR